MQKKQFMAFRLDDNVVITLLAVCILASFAFVLRYRSYKPCTDFVVETQGRDFKTGTMIRFTTNAKDFKKLEWDFGDNNNIKKNVTEIGSAVYSYDAPGQYVIKLIKDGRCFAFTTISISEAPEVIDSTVLPLIAMPDSAFIGEPVTFEDVSKNAKIWDWRYGDGKSTNSSAERKFTTVFSSEGIKTISLTINGSNKAVIRRLVVIQKKDPNARPFLTNTNTPIRRRNGGDGPLPPPIVPFHNTDQADTATSKPVPIAPKIYPQLDPRSFVSMMEASTGGKGRASDFQKYFCDDAPSIPVVLNGSTVSFQELVKRVSAVKKPEHLQLKVQIFANKTTNCVSKMSIIGKARVGVLGMSWRDL